MRIVRPISLVVLFCAVAAAGAADVMELYPNGRLKFRYTVDAQKRKQGTYTEWTEKGSKTITAVYKDDKLNGNVTHYDEKGVIVLAQAFKDGEPVFGRTTAQIRKKLAEIDPDPGAKSETEDANRAGGLRRLKAYRYLANVPYENMGVDKEYNRLCEAGAKLCEKIGQLDHTPKNPGLPEAEFKDGYTGTSNSNLARGPAELSQTIDLYMDDSNESNISRVGHRRWCLNPAMQKTGFGRSGEFSAMWSMDRGQRAVPDFMYVSYPSAGYMPVEYFKNRHAWSVSLNPSKFRVTPKGKAAIYEVDEILRKGDALKLDFDVINLDGMGIPNCFIFRPEQVDVSPGKRYLVQITGLLGANGAPLPPLSYLVEFIDLK
jgi:hypothetical protein